MGTITDEILARLKRNRWPIGWSALTCHGVDEENLIAVLDDILDDAGEETAIVFVFPGESLRLSRKHQSFSVRGDQVFDLLSDLLDSDLFRFVAVWPWGMAGPGDEGWGNGQVYRVAYLSGGVTSLWNKVAGTRATVLIASSTASFGGASLGALLQVKLNLVQNHDGIMLAVGGRESVPGCPPVMLQSEGGDGMFFTLEGEFPVTGGRVPKFLDVPDDLNEFYTAKEYREINRLKTVRMFSLRHREHLGMLPEFLVRRLYPDAVDLSGRVSFRPVPLPPVVKRSTNQAAAFFRRHVREAERREMLANLPDEL